MPKPRRPQDVAPETVTALNAGAREAETLAEALAVRFDLLMATLLPPKQYGEHPELFHEPGTGGVTARMVQAGAILYKAWGLDGYERLVEHPSDTVRGWAAHLLAKAGEAGELDLALQLALVRPLADDRNAMVRESAWLALRPAFLEDMERAIALLAPWAHEDAANLRRYASEATRPRGVWCRHSALLKARPELGLPILQPLRADPARYVKLSVGNWLNDAGKDRPDFVRALCGQWTREAAMGPEDERNHTAHICKRALRNL